MQIQFWGVRGSIASPGPDTVEVGGNTSCVEVRCGETHFILDAGTGLRRLGDALVTRGPVTTTLLLSHLHWDHIQGLPFFVPAYLASTELQIVGSGWGTTSVGAVLAGQMTSPVFPVRLDELSAHLQLREVRSGERFAVGAGGDAQVRAVRLNHPGGVLAYRIDHGGHSMVYATDTEHYACVDPALRALAEGADVLIYDSQYTPEEYRGDVGRSRVGWGHSTYVAGAELARAAGVGRYVLFHHDPCRSDGQVAALERAAQGIFANAVAAREGMVISLGALAQAA
jgi:phosphoribosyl 1,2-cyclic phosphodiesterase